MFGILEDEHVVVTGLLALGSQQLKLLERLPVNFSEGDLHVEVQHIEGILELIDLVVEDGEFLDGAGILFFEQDGQQFLGDVIENFDNLDLVFEFLLQEGGTLAQVAVEDEDFILDHVEVGFGQKRLPRFVYFSIVGLEIVTADFDVLVNVQV